MTNNQLTSTHLAVKSELDGYKIHASRGQATAMAMVRLFESIDRDLEELQERRKAEKDSEPVAWTWHYREQWHVTNDERRAEFVAKDGDVAVLPLYRHARPAPEKYNVGDATMRHIFTPTGMTNISDMQAVFDRVEAVLVGMDQPAPVVGYVPLGDSPYDIPYSMPSNLRELIAEEIGILFSDDDAQSVWNVCRRAAMLAAAQQPPGSDSAPVPGKWIPVSERLPEAGGDMIVFTDGIVMSGVSYAKKKGFYIQALEYDDDEPVDSVTHWMSLPSAPQEVKGE